jgi:hypothetical protein
LANNITGSNNIAIGGTEALFNNINGNESKKFASNDDLTQAKSTNKNRHSLSANFAINNNIATAANSSNN